MSLVQKTLTSPVKCPMFFFLLDMLVRMMSVFLYYGSQCSPYNPEDGLKDTTTIEEVV